MAKRKELTKRLGELLVEKSLISEEQLQMALEDQKKNGGMVGEILVSWGYTTEEAIVQALSSQYDLPFILPSTYQADEDVIALIPKEFASRHSIVALDKVGSLLTAAMSNPLDYKAIDELENLTKLEVKVFITTFTEIMRTIERHYQVMKPGST